MSSPKRLRTRPKTTQRAKQEEPAFLNPFQSSYAQAYCQPAEEEDQAKIIYTKKTRGIDTQAPASAQKSQRGLSSEVKVHRRGQSQTGRFMTPQREVFVKRPMLLDKTKQGEGTRNFKYISSKFDMSHPVDRHQSTYEELPQHEEAFDPRMERKPSTHKYGDYTRFHQAHSSQKEIQKRSPDRESKMTIAWGYPGGRRTRCTDKFIRYPYPKSMLSEYQKDFSDKLKKTVVITKDDAFNLEKENKIINPHRMELGTTTQETFKRFNMPAPARHRQTLSIEKRPIIKHSQYQKAFPNWQNSKVVHEKSPQYPFYSLPFKGESSYKQAFNEEQQQKLKEYNHMISQIGASQTSLSKIIGINQYQPQVFDSETTNRQVYKAFHLKSRPKVQTQKVEPVMQRALPSHFDTFNKKEFVKHNYKISKLDLIPYP